MSSPEIDGPTLDTIEQHLRRAYQQRRADPDMTRAEQAITASEMADRLGIDDADGHPKTREAIKAVMREREIPAIGYSHGYYIPLSEEPIETAIESLEGRKDGITERQQLLRDNWDAWVGRTKERRARADGGDVEIPDEVREKIEDDPVLTVEDWVKHQRKGGEADV